MHLRFGYFNKKREKSHSTAGVRSGSNESVSSPPAKGSKKDGGKSGSGIVTGSLRINVSGMGGKNVGEGPELDIPYIEDTSTTKPKERSFIDSLHRNLT